MKSRQKITVSDKNLHSRSECGSLLGRRNFSYPALQKHVDFLQTYNKIFRQSVNQPIGDADRYFRSSLRSEPFDLIRDLNLDNRSLVRSVRSLESICRRKPRSRQTLPSYQGPEELWLPSKPEPQPKEEFLEIFSSQQADNPESDTDSGSKEFLTPRQTELELVEEVSEEETPKPGDFAKMADEEEAVQSEDALPETIPETTEDNITQGGETDMEFPSDYEDDDEMKEVEKMINAASEQLQQVVEENEKMMIALDAGEAGESGPETGQEKEEGGGSVFNYDPAIDSAVLRELEAAEAQAKVTAGAICELRSRVAELLKKEKMTEAEAIELEEKNAQLSRQMRLFEEKIKRIQFLITQTNLFESMVPPCGPLQTKHAEDKLPKVIVCGLTENNMPKIIVCNDAGRKVKCASGVASMRATPKALSPRTANVSPRTEYAKKLNECICMQEKLAAENADLEGKRFKLQSDVLSKDQVVESLQQQLAGLQAEMRMICQENVMLNNRLQGGTAQCAPRSQSPSPVRGKSCGKARGICPADVESRLQEYSKNTELLEKHLGDMENEIKGIQKELVSVQKEREHLEHHRKMLCPPPTCFPPCIAPPCAPPKPSNDQQLRELKEQYNRLQDDFKNKLIEVSSLRTENEKLKETTKSADQAKKAAEDKMRELENELKRLKGTGKRADGSKEQMIEIEQQLNVAKQRFREAQDELEELRALTEDQREQLNDYRNKYLEAQQCVEEQRRHIDLMEVENQRVSEQVNLEIQRVKNQFQEKLQELMPLPDILKATQLKLQEAQQMHLLAERNNEAIGKELKMYRDKVAALTSQIDEVRSDQQLGSDARMAEKRRIEDLERQLAEVDEENMRLKNEVDELHEKAEEAMRLAEERLHEITQLESQLDSVREESARQIARTKERCEIVRKSMQNQISDLERQMAQSRAIAKAAQKDRDEIRAKMQAQINNLNENFEDAQMRIRNLQGHVNFLKNSYGDVLPQQDAKKPNARPDPCYCASEY